MTRPVDWYVLDLDEDPTPGDPIGVRQLSRHARAVADDAEQAEHDVRGLAGDDAVTSWIGAAGDVFRGALDDFPSQLRQLADSYGQAAAALTGWAGELDGAQDQADRALALGREARARVESLTSQLSDARGSAAAASDTVSRLEGGAEPPDPDQVRAATRNAQAAANRAAALSGALSEAQGQLDAAKRMALDARELREQAAGRAGDRLHDASDAGIEPNSFWENFTAAVASVWEVVVTVATVVAIVVAVIAIFVGGPLVWGILLAASAVLLADSLMRYANGEGSLWEVGLNLLGIVPGGRLLTSLGRISGLARAGARTAGAMGRGLTAAGTALRGAAVGVRSGAGRLAVRMADETGSISLELLAGFIRGAGRGRARFGWTDDFNYRETFFAAHPTTRGQVVVHHAVEQQALTRYPGIVQPQQMHSLENLRGIPNAINNDVHLSQIRRTWNQFYRTHPNPTQQDLLDQATKIDDILGGQFNPPIR